MSNRRFSIQQTNYMKARAAYDVSYKACRDYDKLMDAEGAKLGLKTPFAILPEGHPMNARAQALLDQNNIERTAMYEAAHALMDWGTETALAACGTAKQKVEIRNCVAKVKGMAHVEAPFEKLVDLTMNLAV